MPFSRAKRLPYNARKRLILSALERAWPEGLRADAVAWQTRIPDRWHVYFPLARLARWGLVERRRDAQGLLVYRITARGRRRLAWLRGLQSSG